MSTEQQYTPAPADSPSPETRNEIKVGYLVTGLVFLGLVGIWALRQSGAIGDVTVGWLAPALLVVAGVVGLLALVAGSVRRRSRRTTPAIPSSRETGDHTQEEIR